MIPVWDDENGGCSLWDHHPGSGDFCQKALHSAPPHPTTANSTSIAISRQYRRLVTVPSNPVADSRSLGWCLSGRVCKAFGHARTLSQVGGGGQRPPLGVASQTLFRLCRKIRSHQTSGNGARSAWCLFSSGNAGRLHSLILQVERDKCWVIAGMTRWKVRYYTHPLADAVCDAGAGVNSHGGESWTSRCGQEAEVEITSNEMVSLRIAFARASTVQASRCGKWQRPTARSERD
jgi:hypothetical protein